MDSFAPNGGSVIVPADGQDQSGERDPGSRVLRRPLVLLAVAGSDLLVAHEPLQLGRRISAGRDAFQLKVFAGGRSDLDRAGVVSNSLDDNFAWGF